MDAAAFYEDYQNVTRNLRRATADPKEAVKVAHEHSFGKAGGQFTADESTGGVAFSNDHKATTAMAIMGHRRGIIDVGPVLLVFSGVKFDYAKFCRQHNLRMEEQEDTQFGGKALFFIDTDGKQVAKFRSDTFTVVFGNKALAIALAQTVDNGDSMRPCTSTEILELLSGLIIPPEERGPRYDIAPPPADVLRRLGLDSSVEFGPAYSLFTVDRHWYTELSSEQQHALADVVLAAFANPAGIEKIADPRIAITGVERNGETSVAFSVAPASAPDNKQQVVIDFTASMLRIGGEKFPLTRKRA